MLITGASSGIGKACAIHLAARGYHVFAGVRKQEDHDALAASGQPSLQPVFLDVTDPESIERAFDRVSEAVGPRGLYALINNAGITVAGPVELLSVQQWQQQYDVNVLGVVAVTIAALPMLRTGSGRILNIGSISGCHGLPFMGPYASSKSALAIISDSLRVELMPWNLQVTLVQLGNIQTPIWERTEQRSEELWQRVTPDEREKYADRLDAFRQMALNIRCSPPKVVTRAVEKILSKRRAPRIRRVGSGSLAVPLFSAIVPSRLQDWLINKALRRQAAKQDKLCAIRNVQR